MISPPNEALAARDPALPGLRLLLDPDALAAALGTPAVSLRHLRYKPGASCTAAAMNAEGQWLRLRALTRARHTEKGNAEKGLLGKDCIEIGSPALDRGVPGLRAVWPEDRRGTTLARLFGESHLAQARLSPLSYRLGRRLVARLDHPLGGALLKLHAPSRFAQAQAGALLGAFLGHGRMERACAKTFAVAMRWTHGAVLTAADGPKGFEAAGAALAAVHGTSMDLPVTQSRAAEIAAVGQTLKDAGYLLPEQRARLARLAARLGEALAAALSDPGVIHGDFSADQVVMAGDRPCLIDWDSACTGDRGADLGSALARLDADRILDGVPADAARQAGQALVSGYGLRRALPASVEVQRLAHLARLLTEPFRRQLADWPGTTAALLAEIEQGLDCLLPAGPGDAALPQLATLCDRAGAQTLLDGAGLGRLAAAPRLLRHKAGRRALVELVAETPGGRRTWLAKTRSRRPDHASPALHQELRAAGFDGAAGAAFGVPETRPGPDGMRTFLMAHVSGRPLADWLTPGADPEPFRAAGRALAALHAASVDPGRAWLEDDELAVADRALAAVSERHPDLSDRIAGLRAWARTLSQAVPSGPPVLLHRDFHQDQALVGGTRIWLVDLDLAARGDRHVDLGNFLAHLTEFSIRRFGDRLALLAQSRAFLDGYSQAGGDWSEVVLDAMHALSLLRHLDICARFADRKHALPALLECLGQWQARRTGTQSARTRDPDPATLATAAHGSHQTTDKKEK